MRTRLLPGAALLALACLAPVAYPAEVAGKPAVLIRVASVDDLLSDVRFLAEAAGEEDRARNFEGMIKALTDGKGLQGVDTTRPLGAYGHVGPQGVDSTLVVMVPIADEKAFLDLLGKFVTPSSKDGLYEVEIEAIHMSAYFRFANKYLYATIRDKEVLDKNQLLAPAEVFPGKVGALSATVHIDRIPADLRNLVLGQIDLNLAKLKEAPLSETPAQSRLHVTSVDTISSTIKSLLRDGGPIEVGINVHRQARELALSVSLSGKPGSDLAAGIRELGKVKSVAAALTATDSGMSVQVGIGLPARIRDTLGPVLDELEQKIKEGIPDKAPRDLVEALAEAVKPTLKNAELHAGFDVRGPAASGKYTVVACVGVKDGAAIEKALQKIAAAIPADQKAQIKVDFDKVGAVSIHRIMPEKVAPDVKALLGDNPLYLAVREDAIFLGAGEAGLDAIKGAIAAEPREGKIFQLDLSAARMAPFLEKENKGATESAKKVFAKDKDADKVRISLSGGESLQLRLVMKAPVLRFLTLLDEAKKGGP
jgi:hypothetical protein